jgi:surface antigen
MAVVTDPLLAGAFRDVPPTPGATVREFIREGKYYRSEIVEFSSLASMQLPDQQFTVQTQPSGGSEVIHAITIKGNPAAMILLRGRMLRYAIAAHGPIELGRARFGSVDIEGIKTANGAVWEIPLELLTSRRVETLIVSFSTSRRLADSRPVLTAIEPNPVPGLDSLQTLTLTGTGFSADARVTLRTNNQAFKIPPERTRIVGPTRIQIQVNVTRQTAEWMAEVSNPDRQVSNSLAFVVDLCPGGVQVTGPATPGNVFDQAGLRGYCTWYVAERWLKAGNPHLPSSGDARLWALHAPGNGFWVDTTKSVPGSVMVIRGNDTVPSGHVAYVEAVDEITSQFIVTERNFGAIVDPQAQKTTCFNRVTKRTLKIGQVSELVGFIYPEAASNAKFAEIVTGAYREILRRDPAEGERAYYVGLLKRGTTESEIRVAIEASAAARSAQDCRGRLGSSCRGGFPGESLFIPLKVTQDDTCKGPGSICFRSLASVGSIKHDACCDAAREANEREGLDIDGHWCSGIASGFDVGKTFCELQWEQARDDLLGPSRMRIVDPDWVKSFWEDDWIYHPGDKDPPVQKWIKFRKAPRGAIVNQTDPNSDARYCASGKVVKVDALVWFLASTLKFPIQRPLWVCE